MKNAKIGLLVIGMVAYNNVYSGAQESLSDRMKYKQETNESFIYDKQETKVPLNNQAIDEYVDIKVAKHKFDSGITRTKTQVTVLNDQIITSVETWITNNPSRLTATNVALGGAALAGAGGLAYVNRDKLKNFNDYTSPFQESVAQRYNQASQGLGKFAGSAQESFSSRYNSLRNRFGRSKAQENPVVQLEEAPALESDKSMENNAAADNAAVNAADNAAVNAADNASVNEEPMVNVAE